MSNFDKSYLIYSYTREDAINDGVLIDLTEIAKKEGFKHHTAVTGTLYAAIFGIVDEGDRKSAISSFLHYVVFWSQPLNRKTPISSLNTPQETVKPIA